jgi:hypothetical protein
MTDKPVAGVPEANWLPTAPGKLLSSNWRDYVPKGIVTGGQLVSARGCEA